MASALGGFFLGAAGFFSAVDDDIVLASSPVCFAILLRAAQRQTSWWSVARGDANVKSVFFDQQFFAAAEIYSHPGID